MQYPDYENGLVNLSNSILRSFGAKCKHQTLPCLDTVLDKGYQNVVLMLFDGMGMDSLEHFLPEDSFMRSHLVRPISSVFPSTTTAATTSIVSGLTPYEHGWLGWSLYFKEIDKIVDLFPNTIKDSNAVPAAEYHVAEKYLPYETIGQAITRAGQGRMEIVSNFEGHIVARHSELFKTVRQLCGEPGRKFIYAYWFQPDAIMHKTGCYSKQSKEAVVRINKSVKELCAALSDTLVIVIADHGHINTRYQFVTDTPELVDMLVRPVAVEGRATAFYVKEECKAQFPEEFAKEFGENFLLLSREEVVAKKLFGDGVQNPRFLESIGDYLAVAVSDVAIAYSQKSKLFVSNHAGLTEQEMNVPLILIEKPAH